MEPFALPAWARRRCNRRLRWRRARAAEAVAGRPGGRPLRWECWAARSRQARPEEARGASWGAAQGGRFCACCPARALRGLRVVRDLRVARPLLDGLLGDARREQRLAERVVRDRHAQPVGALRQTLERRGRGVHLVRFRVRAGGSWVRVRVSRVQVKAKARLRVRLRLRVGVRRGRGVHRVVAAVARRLEAELLPVPRDDAAERALRRVLGVGGAEHGAAEVRPPAPPKPAASETWAGTRAPQQPRSGGARVQSAAPGKRPGLRQRRPAPRPRTFGACGARESLVGSNSTT